MREIKLNKSKAAVTYPFMGFPHLPGYKMTPSGEVVSFKKRIGGTLLKGGGYKWIISESPQTFIKINIDTKGYRCCGLIVNGKAITPRMRQLVLIANGFPRPSKKHVARHLDGNKINDSIDNLVWGTYLENGQDRSKHGIERGDVNHNSKLSPEQVRVIRASKESARTLSGTYAVTIRTIYNIKINKTYKGVK